MILAYDSAAPATDAVLAAAKAADPPFGAVGRYLGTGHKLLTDAEARRITDAGLHIFTYFERWPTRAREGRRAGLEDGATALGQARALGMPKDAGICPAVDYDAPMSDQPAIQDYWRGFAAGLAGDDYRLGCYAGGAVCRALRGAGIASYAILAGGSGWRGTPDYSASGAWAGHQFPTQRGLGIEIDPVNLVSLEAVGAWNLDGLAKDSPAPAPSPSVATTPTDAVNLVKALQTDLQALGLYTGRIDGLDGPMTSAAAVRAWAMANKP